MCWQGIDNHWPFYFVALAYMVQILFTVFGMGHIYENAQIIHNHGTLLHTTVVCESYSYLIL